MILIRQLKEPLLNPLPPTLRSHHVFRGFLSIILLLIFVFITGCLSSSTPEPEEPLKSFLWEVSSKTNTVYVLGSIHVATPDLYPLNDVIEDTFEQSENLVVEIDITSLNIWETQRLLDEKAKYAPGETLEDNIPDDLYQKLKKKLGIGLSILNLDSYEPWYVAMTITELELMELGYKPEHGIDMYFLNQAKEQNKNILEFETVEFQLDLLDSFPEDLQVIMLEDALGNPDTKEYIEQMFIAWETGNVSEMENTVMDDLARNPEYQTIQERLLDERNFLMVEKIEKLLEGSETSFVVVGAAHLIGENGIINLLNNAGYEPVQL